MTQISRTVSPNPPAYMNTVGELPKVGTQAPNLSKLMQKDGTVFDPKTLHEKVVILNIYPSINSRVCPLTVIEFNNRAKELNDTVVLGISRDQPGALNQFCTDKSITNVVPLSAHRLDCTFGDDFGVRIKDGIAGTEMYHDQYARALVAVDFSGKVIYSELVTELTNQPNYDACIGTVKKYLADNKKGTSKDASSKSSSTTAAAPNDAKPMTFSADSKPSSSTPLSSVLSATSSATATAGGTTVPVATVDSTAANAAHPTTTPAATTSPMK